MLFAGGRNRSVIACWHACMVVAGLGLPAATAAAADDSVAPLRAAARRAGLRLVEGRHLTLVTDRPARAGDGVDDLPRLFDEAFAAWCRHFAIDPRDHRQWRAFGCLVVDRERFREAGLLPESVPDFSNGFCDRNRFWMIDQSNAAYRRHLLLHEGVHAFTISLRNLDTPAWYTEGIAELLATHRLEPDVDGLPRLVVTPIPQAATDVEQLGRIEAIQRLRAAGAMPGLDDVFTAQSTAHGDMTLYASSWAAVALLSLHPRHAAALKAVEQGPLDRAFTAHLRQRPGWDATLAARDFDAFTDDVDYGYDFSRSAIDWAPGAPLEDRRTLQVDAARGWQNSGLRLTRGRRYVVRARGRAQVGQASACRQGGQASACREGGQASACREGGQASACREGEQCRLETEPDGISIDWYRHRPLGRLLAAQWVESPDAAPGARSQHDAAPSARRRFVVVGEGAAAAFVAPVDGPLFFKLNDPPGALADNEGGFRVEVEPLTKAESFDSP
jgi:hypothetical protein